MHFGPQRKSRTGKRSKVKNRAKRSRQGKTTQPQSPLIRRTPEGRALQVTENWIVSVAEPRFAKAVREGMELAGGDFWEAVQRHIIDPIDITYYILQGEVPSSKIPLKILGENRYNFAKLQSDNSKLETYFPDRATLDLYRKIHRKVENALVRLRRSRGKKRQLLFPV